jgi:hypothetical protein
MRTHLIALSVVVLFSSLASVAAAQPARESSLMLEVRATTDARASVAPHLADETMALEAPSGEEYVLPVLGVVLGGAATITGLIGVLGSAAVLSLLDDGTPTDAGIWLGGSAAVAVVGALSLGISIASLRNLHHRANDAEAAADTGVQVIQFTPTPSGAILGVGGTF